MLTIQTYWCRFECVNKNLANAKYHNVAACELFHLFTFLSVCVCELSSYFSHICTLHCYDRNNIKYFKIILKKCQFKSLVCGIFLNHNY